MGIRYGFFILEYYWKFSAAARKHHVNPLDAASPSVAKAAYRKRVIVEGAQLYQLLCRMRCDAAGCGKPMEKASIKLKVSKTLAYDRRKAKRFVSVLMLLDLGGCFMRRCPCQYLGLRDKNTTPIKTGVFSVRYGCRHTSCGYGQRQQFFEVATFREGNNPYKILG